MLLSVVLSFGFTSCNDDIQEYVPEEVQTGALDVTTANLVGKWKYTYYDYNDVADNYVIINLAQTGSMTTTYYDVDGQVLKLLDGTTADYGGLWSLNGNTLTFQTTNGE